MTGKRTMKRRLAWILAWILLVSLTACGKNPAVPPEAPVPATSQPVPEDPRPQEQPVQTREDGLSAFRADMKPPVIAVADFGFPELRDDYGELDYLWDTYPEWMAEHDFVGDISQDRIIRTCGYEDWGNLMCIVPIDPLSTVAVNVMMYMDHPPYTREVVAYQSESAEPILLLAEASEDVTISVVVTDNEGRGLSWEPCWDSRLPIPEDACPDAMVTRFTPESEVSVYEYNISHGWKVPESGALQNTNWLSFNYAMDLMEDAVDGQDSGWVIIYDVDEIGAYTQSYTGSWQYAEGSLHLSLIPEFGDGYLVDDSFPVLMMDDLLWIGRNEAGNGLPHFYEDQLSDVLDQPKG